MNTEFTGAGGVDIGKITNWTYVLLPDLQVYGLKTFSNGNFCGILDVLGMVHNVPRNTLAVPIDGRAYHAMHKVAKQRELSKGNSTSENKVEDSDAGERTPPVQEAPEEAATGTG